MILSGATTDLEALQSVFALEGFDPDRPVYPSNALARVLDLPVIRGSDHAEGIAAVELDGKRRMVVAYDSPHDDRTEKSSHRLSVDLFALGGGSSRPAPKKIQRRTRGGRPGAGRTGARAKRKG